MSGRKIPLFFGAWCTLLLGLRLEQKATFESKLEASKARIILEWGSAFDESQNKALESSFDKFYQDRLSLLEEDESISKVSEEDVMYSKDETLNSEMGSEIMFSFRSNSGE